MLTKNKFISEIYAQFGEHNKTVSIS